MRSALPESVAYNRPSQALKTYDLVLSPGLSSKRALEFQDRGHTVLYMERDWAAFQSTRIILHAAASNGPVLAASKLPSWSRGVKVHVGPPGDQWQSVKIGKVKKPRRAQYEFQIGAVRYCWRMTHNKGLGVKSFGDLGLELIDLANEEQILAVFATDKKLGRKGDVAGRVALFLDLREDLEAVALAVVLGVDELTRKARSSSSAGAAAAAAGDAAGGAAAADGGGGGGC